MLFVKNFPLIFGTIVFTAEDTEAKAKDSVIILLKEETSPDDIIGIHVAKAVITSREYDIFFICVMGLLLLILSKETFILLLIIFLL